MKLKYYIALFILILISGPLYLLLSGSINLDSDWRIADRTSAKIAPLAQVYKPALIQVYAARAYHWRGLFAVHTWIAVKTRGAAYYTIYQVSGWRLMRSGSSVSKTFGAPDRFWFDHKPYLVLSISGRRADMLIPRVENAIRHYPYQHTYRAWPGPNSNTFLAYIGRQVPELHLALPATALGKDYLGPWTFFGKTPDHSGYQFSVRGMLGVLISKESGVQLNLLGLVYGFSWSPWRIYWGAL